jgi:MFS family permease
MSFFAGGMPIGIDGEEKVKIPVAVEVDDSTQSCDEKGRKGGGMDYLAEPLLSRTNNDASRAQSNDDNYSNADHHENSTTPTQRDDEENNNYLPLIDDHDGDGDGDVDGNFTDYDDNQNERYSLDSQRFSILAIFCLNNLIGSAVWITFAPIEDAVKAKFREYDGESSSSGISNQQINWLSMISMAVYGPGTAFCAWVVPKYGFRETVIASSIIMALGCFLRWLSLSFVSPDGGATSSDYSSSTLRYFILLTGQGLVALGQTIFMNAPARVAASWFQQTTKSIAAINLCSSIGIIFGQLLSPLCVMEETGEHLDQLLAAQGVAMGICALFTGYGFRYEEPACPPSAAESVRRRERQFDHSSSPGHTVSSTSSVSKDVRKLLTNPQYIILMAAFGINYGLNGAIVTLMQPWVASSGFPGDQTAGLCGSLLIGGGLIGTWIASILLDYTRDFNQAIRWSFASTSVVAIGLVATLRPESPTWILATAFTITGMTQMPLLTICFDAVAAHTYPVSEELSSAGLQLAGQYLGIFLVDGMSYLIESASSGEDDDDSNNEKKYGFSAKVNIFYLSLLGLSAAIACCYKSDDLRANITNDRERLQNSGSQTTALLGDINSHANTNDNHE